jgi:hypothetical protein
VCKIFGRLDDRANKHRSCKSMLVMIRHNTSLYRQAKENFLLHQLCLLACVKRELKTNLPFCAKVVQRKQRQRSVMTFIIYFFVNKFTVADGILSQQKRLTAHIKDPYSWISKNG